MSEAAPSVGEATPQPAPEGQPGQSQVGSPGAVESAEATGQDGLEVELTRSPKIKPIKLPGVMEDGPEDARERPETQEARQRDEKGRFVSSSQQSVAVEGTEGAAPEPQAPEPPVDPNTPKKFVFAGKEFESQQAAEQNFKSLQGQFKPLIEDRNAAAHSANAWKQVADGQQAKINELQAELERYRTSPAQSQPAEAKAPSNAPNEIDWDLYAEIRKQADAAGEPWKAERWLQQQQQAIWEAKEAALREELSKPIKAAQARQKLAHDTEQLFGQLAEYTNDSDGQPSFPELRDPEKAFMVGRLWSEFWASSGVDKDMAAKLATTEQGAVAALALYRMIESAQIPEPTAQGSLETSPPPQPDNPALAAAELEGGRPEAMPSASGSNVDPQAAAIISGLKKRQLTKPGLGFSD